MFQGELFLQNISDGYFWQWAHCQLWSPYYRPCGASQTAACNKYLPLVKSFCTLPYILYRLNQNEKYYNNVLTLFYLGTLPGGVILTPPSPLPNPLPVYWTAYAIVLKLGTNNSYHKSFFLRLSNFLWCDRFFWRHNFILHPTIILWKNRSSSKCNHTKKDFLVLMSILQSKIYYVFYFLGWHGKWFHNYSSNVNQTAENWPNVDTCHAMTGIGQASA